MSTAPRAREKRPDPYTLTHREGQVWELRQAGRSAAQIAGALGLTRATVEKYLTTIGKVLADRELRDERERRMG